MAIQILMSYRYVHIMIRALYRHCDTHYIATSPKKHSNQYPNSKQYPKPCPNPNTTAYALKKCYRNIGSAVAI